MIAADEDALICDLAQTYGVLDYRSLPVRLLATLAAGLGPDSRVRRGGVDQPELQCVLLAALVDRLTQLICGLSGREDLPPAVLDLLTGPSLPQPPGPGSVLAFESGADFEAAMTEARAALGGDADGH